MEILLSQQLASVDNQVYDTAQNSLETSTKILDCASRLISQSVAAGCSSVVIPLCKIDVIEPTVCSVM